MNFTHLSGAFSSFSIRRNASERGGSQRVRDIVNNSLTQDFTIHPPNTTIRRKTHAMVLQVSEKVVPLHTS